MKIALEAEHGFAACCPEHLLDGLAKIAESEGADREAWLGEIAKAAGAVQVTAPAVEHPRFDALSSASAEAKQIYETGITLALTEIYELLKGAAEKVDPKALRIDAHTKR